MSKNIYLFYGEDSYSSGAKVKSWISQFTKKYGKDDLQIIEGKKLDPSSLLTDLNSLPFLSEKRLIVVRDFLSEAKEAQQKHLTEQLQEIPEFSILIFHENKSPDKRKSPFKKLKKLAESEEFNKPDPKTLALSLSKQTDLPHITITQLINHVGPDLHRLHHEIQKLRTFKPEGTITQADIEQLCTPSLETSIFTLTDQLSQKHNKRALNTLNKLAESGEDLIRTFFMLVRHFRILIQVKALKEDNLNEQQIKNILKLHPFVIKKSLSQCQNFSMEKLKAIYQTFLDIDHHFKTGKIKTQGQDHKEYLLAIEKLIISI